MTTLLAAELPMCLALNRWGASSVVHGFFATISRLGDGVFWYASMFVLATLGGDRGAAAALHKALTGLVSLALYRALKHRIRRPRPCEANPGVIARVVLGLHYPSDVLAATVIGALLAAGSLAGAEFLGTL